MLFATLVLAWLGFALAAATNMTNLVSKTPTCALNCLVELLPVAHCPFENPAPCLCPNITLQTQLNFCVQKSCVFVNQTATSNILSELCVDYPKESRGLYMKTVTVVLLCITLPIVLLRLASRWFVRNGFGADDYYAVLALLFTIAGAIVQIKAVDNGLGLHYWTVPPEKGPTLLKYLYIQQLLYTMIMTSTKLSILAFYLRAFPGKNLQFLSKAMMVFAYCKAIAYICLIIFQCKPIHSYWDLNVPGKCLDQSQLAISAGFITIFEDIYILIIPIPVLKTLEVNKTKKFNLIGLFGLGIFACITSLIRLKWTFSLGSVDYDKTWDTADLLIWTLGEVSVMLICSCLPATRALGLRLWENLRKPRASSDPSELRGQDSTGGESWNKSSHKFYISYRHG